MEPEATLDVHDLEGQASTWLVRLTSGDATPEVLQAFDQWRKADPRHEEAIAAARRFWLDLGEPLQARYAPQLASVRPRGRARLLNIAKQARWSIAATLLLLAVGTGREWSNTWQYDATTSVGEQRAMALDDGSTVWLNTGSAANIDVGPHRRRVELARGEAFFDVKRDPARPFIVDAGIGQIRVLGTAFGVQRDGDDVIVTVQRGRVQVSGGGTPPVVITPDQRVRVRADEHVKRVEFVMAEQQLAWKNGQLVFSDRLLSEILDELRRYDRRLLIVQYPDASKIRISATIDLARLDEWYDGLQKSLPLQVTRVGPLVWVRRLDAASSGASKPSAISNPSA